MGAFIPVGKNAPVSRMKSWASKPTSKNVFYAKDFKVLKHQLKKAVKSTCNNKANEVESKGHAEKRLKGEGKKTTKNREKVIKKEATLKTKVVADKAAKK